MLWIVHCHSGLEANGGRSNLIVTIEAHTGTRKDLLGVYLKVPMAGAAIAGMVLAMPAMWVSPAFGGPMVAPSAAINALAHLPVHRSVFATSA